MNRALTLVEILVIIVVLGVLMALLLPAVAIRHQNAPTTNCSSNLSQITKAMYNYTITKVDPEGEFPRGPLGSAWWRLLYETREVDDPKVFWCPVLKDPRNPGDVDYLGPAADPNEFGAGDAIGCDRRRNHGGEPDVALNWVAKSGDVHKTPSNSPQWGPILKTVRE